MEIHPFQAHDQASVLEIMAEQTFVSIPSIYSRTVPDALENVPGRCRMIVEIAFTLWSMAMGP